jgi:hypothetical protein
MEVEHGVLQGSRLWLHLLLLYINDLTENIKGTKLVLFADDINL